MLIENEMVDVNMMYKLAEFGENIYADNGIGSFYELVRDKEVKKNAWKLYEASKKSKQILDFLRSTTQQH